MTDQPHDLDVVADTRGIDFLRSTTTTRVDREADGDVEVHVTHIARFGVELGAIPDLHHRYGSQLFAPRFLTAEWYDGKLRRVAVTGPRRLKSGEIQGKGQRAHAETRDFEWRDRWLDPTTPPDPRNQPGDAVPLPQVIADRLDAYELSVATLTGGPR